MRYLFIFLISLFVFSSCRWLKPNLMLRTPKDYSYDKLADSLSRQDYKIAPNDIIEYGIYTNSGFRLVEMTSENSTTLRRNFISVTVESDGNVKMPLLGRVNVGGLTLIEAEKLLEEKYSQYYVEPFVTLSVTNKRIIVFPGNGGSAKVIPLQHNNTTVIEALASAGGVGEEGKAYKVKLIRNANDSTNKSLVILMDLSKIEGLSAGKSIVQAGDIIYAEPRYRLLVAFRQELLPILSLLTSILLIIRYSKAI